MKILLDIGNTHTHVGLADDEMVVSQTTIATHGSTVPEIEEHLRGFGNQIKCAAICSVVPDRTSVMQVALQQAFGFHAEELTHMNLTGVGLDYPEPASIGPDRLANAIAACHRLGAPSVVVDFGTAVTFDVVDSRGCYVGGIIAPGVSAMTDYLHEKTALLPRIEIEEPQSVIGKSTREAMLAGAVHGYRGLISELVRRLQTELGSTCLPVIATGGYAGKIAAKIPEIASVDPRLTLEGLRLFLESRSA